MALTIYAGAQKMRADGLHDDIYAPMIGWRDRLTLCDAAHESRNRAIEALGAEQERLKRQAAATAAENARLFKEARVRIDSLKKIAKANTCEGNLDRLADQLDGVLWE